MIDLARSFVLAATLVTAAIAAKSFYHVKPVAGYLMWPYVAFLLYANCLNYFHLKENGVSCFADLQQANTVCCLSLPNAIDLMALLQYASQLLAFTCSLRSLPPHAVIDVLVQSTAVSTCACGPGTLEHILLLLLCRAPSL